MEVLKEEMVVAILGMHCIADYFNIKGGGVTEWWHHLLFLGYFLYAFLIIATLKGREPNKDNNLLWIIFGMHSWLF